MGVRGTVSHKAELEPVLRRDTKEQVGGQRQHDLCVQGDENSCNMVKIEQVTRGNGQAIPKQ